MREENIKKIKKFFLNELNIEETQIKEHRNHDLMIRCLPPTKVKNRFMMIIYFECLDCKEIWKHSIRDSKNFLTLLYGRLGDFLNELQQDEMTRSESKGYTAFKSKDKKYKGEDLDNLSILFVGNNKNLKINSKNSESWEEYEDLDDYDIVYSHNKKKLGENYDSIRSEGLMTAKIVSYGGVPIYQIEAELLYELEYQLGAQFTLVPNIPKSEIRMGYTVEDYRIIGLGVNNWALLKDLPESIGKLKSLRSLSLNHNNIKTIPESFGDLRSLLLLSISGNELRTLPKSFGNLESLQGLFLSWNHLMTLPESIGNFRLLRILVLAYNQLSTLPESIGNLKSLKVLILYDNKLTTLPESIGNLNTLEEAVLTKNQLSTLPESIGNFF